MAIQVNTAMVINTAEQVDTLNKKIRDDMADVDAAIRMLRQNWSGEASNSCANRYEHIKSSFSETRFSVVNGIVSFMRKQVGETYETMEKRISSAAAAFK